MKKTVLTLTIAIMTMVMISCKGDGGTSTQQDNSAQLEQRNQDSIREADAEAERIKKEQEENLKREEEEKARLEVEREAKIWNGATSFSEFKSKLPGTTWGATRKRGDFYFKFEVSGNKIITTAYYSSDFSEDSKFGDPKVEIIDSWKDLDGQNAFTVTAYEAGADKDDWSTVPTMLAFRKGKPDAQWATVDGTIPLRQITE